MDEIKGQYIHSMFDGTSRLGELLNNVLRWCTPDFELVQRLALLMTYEKHLSGAQAARVLTTLYMTTLSIPSQWMIGFGRDSVSANAVTLRSLVPVFTSAEDILCICHTLMNTGKHFSLTFLDEFYSKWIPIVYGTSPQAKAIWKRTIDQALIGFSSVRWYCEGEIIIQNSFNFPLLKPFLTQLVDEGICPTLAPAALEIYQRDERLLKLEHASMVDMRLIISTTYEMEGDLIPQLLGYLRIESIRSLGQNIQNGIPGTLPTVEAILRQTTELKKGSRLEKVCHGPHPPVCLSLHISTHSDHPSPRSLAVCPLSDLGRTWPLPGEDHRCGPSGVISLPWQGCDGVHSQIRHGRHEGGPGGGRDPPTPNRL